MGSGSWVLGPLTFLIIPSDVFQPLTRSSRGADEREKDVYALLLS